MWNKDVHISAKDPSYKQGNITFIKRNFCAALAKILNTKLHIKNDIEVKKRK